MTSNLLKKAQVPLKMWRLLWVFFLLNFLFREGVWAATLIPRTITVLLPALCIQGGCSLGEITDLFTETDPALSVNGSRNCTGMQEALMMTCR